MKYIKNFSAEIEKLILLTQKAEALVIGAGSGLSASAGFLYSGKRFEDNFPDFIQKYGFEDMYSAGFYPYETLEEYWAYWSRYVYLNRYSSDEGKPYGDLLEIVKNRDYFVITTNVDHRFQTAGFPKERLFYTQGDFGLWQCSKPCHEKTYDNENIIRRMTAEQKNMRIPSELIPYCPLCGAPMTMNLRTGPDFVQDEGWRAAAARYGAFIAAHKKSPVVYLELGVGMNTPGIIKYPFQKMTYENSYAFYACVNAEETPIPREIAGRSLFIRGDIGEVLKIVAENQD